MELEELIKHYFNSIDHFKNDEGIASILPGPEHSDYDELMQGLMAKFKEQMEELVLYAQTNDVDNDELIDMLMEIRIKQEAVKKKYTEDKILIEEATKEVQEENEVLDSSRRVIFARGEGDTVLVERDIASILKTDSSLSESFFKLFERLKEPVTNYNEVRERMITNNNKLKGVYEVKEYQLRVFYMYASGCLVVIGANQKKSDNNKVDQAKMIACRKSAAKFVEEIKRNKDEELIAKLENEANEYIENLGTTKTL